MDRATRNDTPTVVWLRLDLRIADNDALAAAAARGGPVVPVFVWDPDGEAPWVPGAASRWWLHRSLKALDRSLRKRGSRLVIRRGPASAAIIAVAREIGATAVVWSRRFEPGVAVRDAAVARALATEGLASQQVRGNLLFEPDELRTQAGGPFQVFTPFWNAAQAMPGGVAPARPATRTIAAPTKWPDSIELSNLGLDPGMDWTSGLQDAWTPGEAGARAALRRFVNTGLRQYGASRDVPALAGTSRLSPHLHFGELSARSVWHAAGAARDRAGAAAFAAFARELGWREFAHHLLHHFPDTPAHPLREQYRAFPWRRDARQLRAWQRGQTGYPIVDAAMRELWATGWMHNRVRMIVASFLVKHLLLPWQRGAEWFWDTLVDADLANNTLGWQWTAGCGADAAPFFRIFNPVLQGEKFDASGRYVRRWVPEIARLPDALLHKPWAASPEQCAKAGLTLGVTYPRPIVDHADARERALAAFATMRD